MLTNQIKSWVNTMAEYLRKEWGLENNFASEIALFYLYLVQYGLSPKITSGFRSPAKQEELRRRYNAGDRTVIVKPAENSRHSLTGFLNSPASRAIDIQTNNHQLAAQIASALKIKSGLHFSTPDPVHFYN